VKGCDLGTKSSLKPDLHKLVAFYTTGSYVERPPSTIDGACTVHGVRRALMSHRHLPSTREGSVYRTRA
jgi:hypothetical protein